MKLMVVSLPLNVFFEHLLVQEPVVEIIYPVLALLDFTEHAFVVVRQLKELSKLVFDRH
jgi:hypothetical protein